MLTEDDQYYKGVPMGSLSVVSGCGSAAGLASSATVSVSSVAASAAAAAAAA